MRDFSQPLAFVALFAHGIGILKQRRPIKTCIQHLHYHFLGSEMTSTCTVMVVVEYPFLFSFRHTLYDYLISIVFEQIRFFPQYEWTFAWKNFLSCDFHSAGNSPVTKKLAMWANQGALSTVSKDSSGNSS